MSMRLPLFLGALPAGRSLPDDAWRRRHRALLAILWIHVPALFALATGTGHAVAHSLGEAAVVAVFATAATSLAASAGRKIGSVLVSLGLLTTSALVVHMMDGAIEGHFHFFVVMALLLLYEDWLPFLLAAGYVLVHHGLLGEFAPESVYNHTAAVEHPWRWAAIHAGFIVAASVANVTAWRLNEDVRARAQREQRRAEASEASFHSAFRDAPIGVGFASVDGTWLEANRVLSEMLGYSPEELRTLDLAAVTAADDVETERHAIRDLVAGKTSSYQLEKRLRTANGDVVPVLVTASLARHHGESAPHLIIQLQDLTARKELEEQLLQSQKMEAVGQLAGGIAHDFNNLLTAITGYTELLRDRIPREAPEAAYAAEVDDAARRAAALTEQLLAFSRRQVLQSRVLDVNDVVERTVGLVARLIGEQIDVVTDFAGTLPLVRADEARLQQVVINLAVNARDAMPNGGTLFIRTSLVELDDVTAKRTFDAPKGRYVALTVQDTGHGMDDATMRQVFEPFFTTKEVGKGTGLGLSTAYGIVRQMDGYIAVDAEVGRGATFTVLFPPTLDDGEAAVTGAPERPSRGRERILVVEDEEVVRELLAATLAASGYSVEAHDGARAALERCETAEFDLVVTDVVMPEMSGVELARLIRAAHGGVAVLFISGYPRDLADDLGLDGGCAYLQKPFAMHELVAQVRALLDARAVLAA